jgi:hypothetical protein
MNEAFNDGLSLIFRFDEELKVPMAPVHLDVSGGTQIVPAIIRPDLLTTVVAQQWADALGLSRGAAALAQIATKYDDSADLWGPCERLTPLVELKLDSEIDERRATGGFLLGQDFLQTIAVTLLGPAQLLVLSHEPTSG